MREGFKMKKIATFVLAAVMVVGLVGCTSGGSNPTNQTDKSELPNLSGEWKQSNSNSDESWHGATISENTIEIYWVSNNGDTKSLYWSGTFVAPETTDEPYTWVSENDKEKTGAAILASGDDTKTFTYEDGQISYSASAMGTTTTVRLEKSEE